MNSDARRSAAPDSESLARLLQRVLDVVEVRDDLPFPANGFDKDEGAANGHSRDGYDTARRRTRGEKSILPPAPAGRSAGTRQAYDALVVTLLRLLVENHPASEALAGETGRDEGSRRPSDQLGAGAGFADTIDDRAGDASPEKSDTLAIAFSKLLSLVDLRRGLLPDVSPYDESWTLLLCAALAEREGRGVSVSELCRRIGCALATGQRRVDRLERLELLDRAPDPDDLRRHSVFPTEKGRKAAQDYAAAVSGRGLLGL